MYRIELSPGEEAVFRSIEELAVAIKRGVVTPRARIYHNASAKWLPIQFHPHYKAAVSMPLSQAALVAGPQSKSLSSLSLELPAEPEPEAVVARAPEPEPEPAPEPVRKKKSSPKRLSGESRSRRQSKPRRQLRIALVGALLIGGAQWVLSVPLFSRSQPGLLVDAERQLLRAQTEAMKRVGEPNTAGMIPVLPTTANTAPAELVQQAPARRRLTAPSFGGNTSVESGGLPDIEPAPAGPEPAVASLPQADSLKKARIIDSSSHKALQEILTTVSGGETPPAIKLPPKR